MVINNKLLYRVYNSGKLNKYFLVICTSSHSAHNYLWQTLSTSYHDYYQMTNDVQRTANTTPPSPTRYLHPSPPHLVQLEPHERVARLSYLTEVEVPGGRDHTGAGGGGAG